MLNQWENPVSVSCSFAVPDAAKGSVEDQSVEPVRKADVVTWLRVPSWKHQAMRLHDLVNYPKPYTILCTHIFTYADMQLAASFAVCLKCSGFMLRELTQ